jgi:hypothetical protein
MQMTHSESQKVSRKLSALARLYETRQASELMQQTLNKLFDVELNNAQKDYDLLSGDLAEFEEKYNMESAEFFAQFEKGELGDDMDFISWASLYQMRERVRQRLELLATSA